ncbi:MAG: sensor histidine kinase KdpD [Candidatus Omnitrophica bacterium]|nr:sensor histidine kinase KdpD [Candidatus Omnitrophota bacterium]
MNTQNINYYSNRPDPEALLAAARADDFQHKGKLKIFLGYSAGVGKTYAMLAAVHRLKQSGVDVVIGYVETHKRKETEALIGEMEIVPRKVSSYKGTSIQEMDLDGVLKRNPQLAVVDELAHTNAPDSRHLKRFQDIEELLAAGIDVYTTLNIQHLESLNDVVAKISGVKTRETIPDRILQEADEIEVVDISIGELLQRLKEGKVYFPEQALRATENFFNEGNLTALRELTLRRAAKRVDAQMQGYIQRRAIAGPWPTQERLLVCVSPYPSSAELVRAGSLLATGLDAQWFVVYVEPSAHSRLSESSQLQITKTLELGQELGAQVVTLTGDNVATEVIRYALRQNITRIIIGKPPHDGWHNFLKINLVDQIIRHSGDIDIHVINRTMDKKDKSVLSFIRPKSPWYYYLNSFLLVAGASLVGQFLRTSLAATNLVMIYLLVVVISAFWWGRGPSILASVMGVAAFDFLFVTPYYTFAVSDTEYLLTFAVLFLVGLVISALTDQTHRQTDIVRQRERRTSALYGLSRELAKAVDTDEILKAVAKQLNQTFDCRCAILLKEKDVLLEKMIENGFIFDEREKAVATWVFQNRQEGGHHTDTLPAAAGIYFPLGTSQGIFGVLGINFNDQKEKMSVDDKNLLESIVTQASLALERVHLVEEARQTQIMREKEIMQSALFDSISHDLKTPLVSIKGALSNILDNQNLDERSKRSLLETANDETLRMNSLINNLLDMARLEAGAFKLSLKPYEVRDLIGTAVKDFEEAFKERKLTIKITNDMPHVPMDFALMVKVLTNIIDNAIKYAPFNLPVDIEAAIVQDRLEIKVLDRGLGIPPEDLEQIFDKFYRVKRPENFEGTGLGLSICKRIVEAHKGKIWAENRLGGGSMITIGLPLSGEKHG